MIGDERFLAEWLEYNTPFERRDVEILLNFWERFIERKLGVDFEFITRDWIDRPPLDSCGLQKCGTLARKLRIKALTDVPHQYFPSEEMKYEMICTQCGLCVKSNRQIRLCDCMASSKK